MVAIESTDEEVCLLNCFLIEKKHNSLIRIKIKFTSIDFTLTRSVASLIETAPL